ncbi:unnamed protein product [Closterium sp. Naga37s-1]|nr:unnamed protein product [Closterium sp. Naga37s-1]
MATIPCPSACLKSSSRQFSSRSASARLLQCDAVSFSGLRATTSRSQVAAAKTSRLALPSQSASHGVVTCGLDDFIGGDLIGLDLGQWVDDVERYGAVGFYSPPEGGAEGRYATSLKYAGYHMMNISARGLGDPEAYLLKTHGVRPPHLGRQAVARFYLPPEVDHRLAVLPPKYKGLVLWIGEAKVLAKNELQFLTLLPALRPNVKLTAYPDLRVVPAGWVCVCRRKFYWKPMQELVGLPTPAPSAQAVPAATSGAEKKEAVPAS